MTSNSADYMRQWRKEHPDLYVLNRMANSALKRAQVRLAQRHPVELDALLNEERRKVGLPPVGPYRREREEP